MPCSLCGSEGVTKTTCPLNPAAGNVHPRKHSGKNILLRVLVGCHPQTIQSPQDHRYYTFLKKVTRGNETFVTGDLEGEPDHLFNLYEDLPPNLSELSQSFDSVILPDCTPPDSWMEGPESLAQEIAGVYNRLVSPGGELILGKLQAWITLGMAETDAEIEANEEVQKFRKALQNLGFRVETIPVDSTRPGYPIGQTPIWRITAA